MKGKKFLSLMLSALLSVLSVSAVPTYADDPIASDGNVTIDEDTIYGDIQFDLMSKPVKLYAGEELDLSDAQLRLGTYRDYYSDFAYPSTYNCVFTVGSGLYSDLYTLDTSNVDTTTPGDYKVTVKPVAGAVGTFTTKNNQSSIGQPKPDGDYEICMKGKESYIPVKIYDKQEAAETPLYLKFYSQDIEIPCGDGIYIELVGAVASDISYEVEDDTIVSVSDESTPEYLVLNSLKEGETTVTVTASDGRTTSEKIRVLPPREETIETEPVFVTTTTLADPYATTTNTSTTTTTQTTFTKWWYEYETTTTTAIWTDIFTGVVFTSPGDANLDGKVTVADAVAILQHVAMPDKYELTGQALENADVYDCGDGVTAMDALSIQKYDAKVITALPESFSEIW